MNRDKGSTPARGLRILFANRAPGKFHSIEELFSSVSLSLPIDLVGKTVTAPYSGVSLKSLFCNLVWFRNLNNFDLIHQTGDIHYSILGRWMCPVVLTILDLRFIDESKGLKRFLLWLLWIYLPSIRANKITVISEFTKCRLLSLCRVSPDKVRVIPCCVANEFKRCDKQWSAVPRILLVGTTSNKNTTRVFEACKGLNVELLIVGNLDHSQKSQLESLRVRYTQFANLDKRQVVQLYEDCDILMFVSTYEGFGIPILEGQAVGRPVITSSISPMCDVAGAGALLVDPFDVGSIHKGVRRLLEDAALREKLITEGFRNVELFSSKAVAEQYASLYREVLNRK